MLSHYNSCHIAAINTINLETTTAYFNIEH